MSEFSDAIELANRLLDEPYVDPDDDLRMLARQLLRRQEAVEKLENRLAELSDNGCTLKIMVKMEAGEVQIVCDGNERIAGWLRDLINNYDDCESNASTELLERWLKRNDSAKE